MPDFAKEKWTALGRKIYCTKNGDIDNTVLLAEVSSENIQDASSIAKFISFTPEMHCVLEYVLDTLAPYADTDFPYLSKLWWEICELLDRINRKASD